jgi:hypothetical protein
MNKFLAVTIVVLSLSLASSAAQASTIGQREALQAAKSYLSLGHPRVGTRTGLAVTTAPGDIPAHWRTRVA